MEERRGAKRKRPRGTRGRLVDPIAASLAERQRCYFFLAAFFTAFFAGFLAAFLVAFFIDLFSVTSDSASVERTHCDLFINLLADRSQEKSDAGAFQNSFRATPGGAKTKKRANVFAPNRAGRRGNAARAPFRVAARSRAGTK
jgi:hypothetical protein